MNKLMQGRMISSSKSGYHKVYPDNVIIFNANIITISSGKIWYGDLDITLDCNELKKFRKKIGEDLYVLYESSARFETENDSIDKLINKAVCRVGEDKIYITDSYKKYYKDIEYKKDTDE